MLFLGTLIVVAFISLHDIAYACDPDPHQGVNWSPSETKGQMTFNQATCQYEKKVQGLRTNTNYEWKVAFNGNWGGDKGCNNGNNCQFNSGSSGVVLLIYNPYTVQLTTSSGGGGDPTVTPVVSTSTISSSTCSDPYKGR